jgi:hypothetical protein
VPLAHGASPSAHPNSSETNVTEFGSNPDDTGDGDGEGDGDGDGSRVGEVLMTADGDELELLERVAGADEHAASSRQSDPVPASPDRA